MAYAVLGPRGSFSEEAAIQYWGNRQDRVIAPSIPEVFKLVEQGRVNEALVPIENSLAGSVKETIQCLYKSRLYICGEILLPVQQDLLACKKYKLSEIELLISQPVALLQCQDFIHKYLPDVRTEICHSTSKAAEMLQKENKKAVSIGNSQAARIYGLEIIYPNIAGKANMTRFVHICTRKRATVGDKSSIIFSLPDRAGALYEALGIFANRNLNLSKIESYPDPNIEAGYYFYIEVDTPGGDDLEFVVQEMEKVCCYVRHLGSYQSGQSKIT